MLYDADDHDRVQASTELPWPEAGAPMPRLVQDEHRVVATYFVGPRWPGLTNVARTTTDADVVAVVTFDLVLCCVFGPPNDEAFSGHPLASRGLQPYRTFEIEDSSLIRKLQRRNAVHRAHDPTAFFKRWRHFVIAFHDSTLEVVASRYAVDVRDGGVQDWMSVAAAALKR